MKIMILLPLLFALCGIGMLRAQPVITVSVACTDVNDGYLKFDSSNTVTSVSLNGYLMVGDAWDWSVMYNFATKAYISFPTTQVPAGYHLRSASLHFFVAAAYGNSQVQAYPSFEMSWGTISPNCLLTHVNYGVMLDPGDLNTPDLHPPLNLFNSYLPGWNWAEVTQFVLDDIQENRPYSQYTFKLQYLSDWGSGDDYLVIAPGGTTGNNPYLFLECAADESSAEDHLATGALIITAAPNPFRGDLSITVQGKGLGKAKLEIFNLRGQKVRTLETLNTAANATSLHWNGKDDQGRIAAPGVYLIRIDNSLLSKVIRVLKQP
ncbi:MAG: T9SS type A sorting domain-containing protein [Candidatus Cloacimonadaceae bacterium]|nr:T9SS type A sorting domain-containing protein [Candidatus Cloacimonadaceae bacterium]